MVHVRRFAWTKTKLIAYEKLICPLIWSKNLIQLLPSFLPHLFKGICQLDTCYLLSILKLEKAVTSMSWKQNNPYSILAIAGYKVDNKDYTEDNIDLWKMHIIWLVSYQLGFFLLIVYVPFEIFVSLFTVFPITAIVLTSFDT